MVVEIVEGKRQSWGKCGASQCNQRRLCGVVILCREGWLRGSSQTSAGCRDSLSQFGGVEWKQLWQSVELLVAAANFRPRTFALRRAVGAGITAILVCTHSHQRLYVPPTYFLYFFFIGDMSP